MSAFTSKHIAFLYLMSFAVLLPTTSHAKRPPDCGDISKSDIRDTYEAASDVRYYYDIDAKIEEICSVMKGFEDWHKDLPTNFRRDKAFDKTKDTLIENTEGHLTDLRRPLRLLYTWIRAETENELERLAKEVQIKERREDIDKVFEKLDEDIENVKKFMEVQNVKLEEFNKNPPAAWWEPKQ